MGSKLQLARSLAQWGYDGDTRRALFDLIDSLLVLPDPLEEVFNETLEQTEDTAMMDRLNSLQRVRLRREKAASLAEGEIKGTSLVLQAQLQHKFGPLPDWALARIAQADTDALRQWALNVLQAEQLENVFEP